MSPHGDGCVVCSTENWPIELLGWCSVVLAETSHNQIKRFQQRKVRTRARTRARVAWEPTCFQSFLSCHLANSNQLLIRDLFAFTICLTNIFNLLAWLHFFNKSLNLTARLNYWTRLIDQATRLDDQTKLLKQNTGFHYQIKLLNQITQPYCCTRLADQNQTRFVVWIARLNALKFTFQLVCWTRLLEQTAKSDCQIRRLDQTAEQIDLFLDQTI